MRRPRSARWLLIHAPLALLLAPRALHAQTRPPAPGSSAAPGAQNAQNATSLQEAQQHLTLALGHFRAREYTEAIHEFQLANTAAPSADLWYNIANAYERLSQFDQAVEYYRRYLRDKVDPPDRADVERRIRELEAQAEQARNAALNTTQQARVRFDVATPGLAAGRRGPAVYLGARLLGYAPLNDAVPVAPGTYDVRVAGDGYQEWRGTVRVRPNERVTAFVTPQRATQYRTRAGAHIASYILGGLGIAGLGTGGVFGVMAATQPAFDPGGAPNSERRDLAGTADILFGVGAGLAIAAVIVYFVEAGSSRTERVSDAPAGSPAR